MLKLKHFVIVVPSFVLKLLLLEGALLCVERCLAEKDGC